MVSPVHLKPDTNKNKYVGGDGITKAPHDLTASFVIHSAVSVKILPSAHYLVAKTSIGECQGCCQNICQSRPVLLWSNKCRRLSAENTLLLISMQRIGSERTLTFAGIICCSLFACTFVFNYGVHNPNVYLYTFVCNLNNGIYVTNVHHFVSVFYW